MLKSALSPINKTAKVTEIKFRVPIEAVANPAVNNRPKPKVIKEAIRSVIERKHRNSKPTTNICRYLQNDKCQRSDTLCWKSKKYVNR